MRKISALIITMSAFLWTGIALAQPSPQQQCDAARITAWKKYAACIEGVMARDAKGIVFDEFAAFARCRHTYFTKWKVFQSSAAVAGSTCVGTRFTDNGDGTVTDNLSGLVWEKKDHLDQVTSSSPHDGDNAYTWSIVPGPPPHLETGMVFTSFLRDLNAGGGFAGVNGWRLPTLTELQTILLGFSCRGKGFESRCKCPAEPCVDDALDSANTETAEYWSVTNRYDGVLVWAVDFGHAIVRMEQKTTGQNVRAVRGGL